MAVNQTAMAMARVPMMKRMRMMADLLLPIIMMMMMAIQMIKMANRFDDGSLYYFFEINDGNSDDDLR